MEIMNFIFNDGGRSKYFKARKVGDCVCRAIAIASSRDYKEVYDSLKKAIGETPRDGVFVKKKVFKDWMRDNGFCWVSCSEIGSTQSTHFVKGELPEGRLVCSVTKHYVAVVNNEVHDIWDSRYNSFGDLRRIYGYWKYCK